MRRTLLWTTCVLLVAACWMTFAFARDTTAGRPVELGHVTWVRDLDAATARARAEDKALLILFQEVPG